MRLVLLLLLVCSVGFAKPDLILNCVEKHWTGLNWDMSKRGIRAEVFKLKNPRSITFVISKDKVLLKKGGDTVELQRIKGAFLETSGIKVVLWKYFEASGVWPAYIFSMTVLDLVIPGSYTSAYRCE